MKIVGGEFFWTRNELYVQSESNLFQPLANSKYYQENYLDNPERQGKIRRSPV